MSSLPLLPYPSDALEPYIDSTTMIIHHDKHHAAYVQNLNDALSGYEDLLAMEIDALLENLEKVPENIRIKVRNNGGGHANHSLFWTLMSNNSQSEAREPQGELLKEINETFGDFPSFQEKFTAAGMGRFGSGWVWLVVDSGKLTITDTPNQDSPLMDGKNPILCLDVWEHAYYLSYQNRRADYIKAWWNIVNWGEVEKRFDGIL